MALARAEAACLKTGVRSRGPRVRIPPPPLRTAKIWLYRALRALSRGPRAAGTEVNQGQSETASAGAFYEPLGLGEGHRFLEVGVGSGYGTSLAREVVGREGLVVAIEIDATTLAFARENLRRAGHTDVVLVHGDGGLGYPEHAPYDRICVTAACPDVPPPLVEQLAACGRLIAPVLEGMRQRLTLLEKTVEGVRRTILADVLYMSLRGRYGVGSDAQD
jgi:protein-L-isoaspartate(D-aspartate) O-methyltransferase